MIQITINGQLREVPDGLNIRSLLEWLDLSGDRVAVEQNREIVQRDHWNETRVKPSDDLEIVQFVGGGANSATVPG